MATLRERVLAHMQISSGPNASSVASMAKALKEPTVFVRFALEQLRDQGIAFRRGAWWSAADLAAHTQPNRETGEIAKHPFPPGQVLPAK
jgi:hypothetical protein